MGTKVYRPREAVRVVAEQYRSGDEAPEGNESFVLCVCGVQPFVHVHTTNGGAVELKNGDWVVREQLMGHLLVLSDATFRQMYEEAPADGATAPGRMHPSESLTPIGSSVLGTMQIQAKLDYVALLIAADRGAPVDQVHDALNQIEAKMEEHFWDRWYRHKERMRRDQEEHEKWMKAEAKGKEG